MSQLLIKELREAVVNCEPEKAEAISKSILDEGIDPYQALIDGAVKGIREVGEMFQEGTYFLPELMMAAEAMNEARAILEPEIRKGEKVLPTAGSVLIGTVQGDLHDIGHGIVAALLRAEGFNVVDVGKDVPVPVFVQKAIELKPDIVGLSALLTVTMPFIDFTTRALREADVSAAIICGGAPVTPEFAERIGIAYAENAPEACVACRELMESGK
jgi:methanogenic corrinoid protein MtbC1